jgi:peptide/nickel transport system permease protein
VTRAAYIRRRLLLMIPIALGVTLLTFLMIHMIPGDPAVTMLGLRASPQRVALLHHEWGLDKPLYEQYWLYLQRVLRGDFGESLFYQSSATGIIIQDFGTTLFLIAYAAVLSIAIAVPLAMVAATHKDGPLDHVVRGIPLIGMGMPTFWVGIMLILLLGLEIHAFPVGGYGYGFEGHVYSLFLPALTLALTIAPVVIRSLRASLVESLEAEYITTARSKGIPERRVLIRHALRNAVVSSVTVLGLEIAWLASGTLVVETVFGLPGVGALMIQSIFRRDFPVVQGITFFLAVLVIVVNLVTDIAHSLLDPRVRFE